MDTLKKVVLPRGSGPDLDFLHEHQGLLKLSDKFRWLNNDSITDKTIDYKPLELGGKSSYSVSRRPGYSQGPVTSKPLKIEYFGDSDLDQPTSGNKRYTVDDISDDDSSESSSNGSVDFSDGGEY